MQGNTRAAVVHWNLRAGSTFPVPVCTVPHGHWVNKADNQLAGATRLTRSDFMLRIGWRNWVFATKSDFLIPIPLQRNVVNLRYFKLWIMLDTIIFVWNIKGLHHLVAKIYGLESLSLWQRLNSFTFTKEQRCVNSSFRNYWVFFPKFFITMFTKYHHRFDIAEV